MKIFKLKTTSYILLILLFVITSLFLGSCFTSKSVAAKPGVQLWSENCQRCHNTPSPSTFSHEQWETIGMHMQTRALLTNDERDKIVKFLQQ